MCKNTILKDLAAIYAQIPQDTTGTSRIYPEETSKISNPGYKRREKEEIRKGGMRKVILEEDLSSYL